MKDKVFRTVKKLIKKQGVDHYMSGSGAFKHFSVDALAEDVVHRLGVDMQSSEADDIVYYTYQYYNAIRPKWKEEGLIPK